MKLRNAVHVSGESRRTSGEFGIGGNIVVPRNIDRAQDLRVRTGSKRAASIVSRANGGGPRCTDCSDRRHGPA
jgi:hypothetical protein